MKKYNSELWDNYIKACNDYLFNFCVKHGFDYEPNDWIAGEPSVIEIADLFISLSDMITDIEMDAPVDEYIKYYDYSMDCHYADIPCMNYENWLKGAPRYDRELLSKKSKEAQDKIFKIEPSEDVFTNERIESLKKEFLQFVDAYKKESN